MTDPEFKHIAIIGIGLLGSSIAHAVTAYGGAERVSMWDISDDVRCRAARVVPGDVANTAQEAVAGADCVFLCTPVGVLKEITAQIAGGMANGAILTDGGAVKAKAAADMGSACPAHVHLIPGHPIAGTEKSGPEAGFASLFQDTWHILTPGAEASADYTSAVERLTAFWIRLGAKVETMDANRHDRVLAITSHLPHLIASLSFSWSMSFVKDPSSSASSIDS